MVKPVIGFVEQSPCFAFQPVLKARENLSIITLKIANNIDLSRSLCGLLLLPCIISGTQAHINTKTSVQNLPLLQQKPTTKTRVVMDMSKRRLFEVQRSTEIVCLTVRTVDFVDDFKFVSGIQTPRRTRYYRVSDRLNSQTKTSQNSQTCQVRVKQMSTHQEPSNDRQGEKVKVRSFVTTL